jgi:hypothetical protein
LKELSKAAEYPRDIELDSSEIGFAEIKTLRVGNALNMEGARLTGVPEAKSDGDAMNLVATKSLLSEAVINMEAALKVTEERLSKSAKELANDHAQEISVRLSEVEEILEEHQRAIALQISEAPLGARALVEALKLKDHGIYVDRKLVMNRSIEGVSAQYRTTSKQIAGELSGADAIGALRKLRPMAYHMPDHAGFLLGIHPDSIPGQFDYIRQVDTDGEMMIDYVQMISPIIASIQVLDRRLQRIEDSLN